MFTTANVANRLIEMFRIIRMTEGHSGPRGARSSLSSFVRSIADGDHENARVSVRGKAVSKRRASPDEIDRMNEALDWHLRFLKPYPVEMKCLLAWANTKSKAVPCGGLHKEFAMSPRDFDAARARGLLKIADGLKRETRAKAA